MAIYNNITPGVNDKTVILSVTPSNDLVLKKSDGSEIKVENEPFNLWQIAATHSDFKVSPKAAPLIQRYNPLRFQKSPYMLTNPMSHQVLALNRMSLGSCALWLDMGCGKTVCVLYYVLKRWENLKDNTFVVVCPTSVFVTWEDEIKKHFDPSTPIDVYIAHGPKKLKILAEARAADPSRIRLIVSSYETLENIRETLERMQPAAVFFDEAQRVKNWGAQRTKTAHAFMRNCPSTARFLLSGTPSTTTPVGYYSLYELIRPGGSGCSNLIAFKHRYTELTKFVMFEYPSDNGKRTKHLPELHAERWLSSNYPPGSNLTFSQLGYFLHERSYDSKALRIVRIYNKETGVKRLDELSAVTRKMAYVVRKESVLRDLPEKTLQRRMIQMSAEQKRIYGELTAVACAQIGQLRFTFKNSNSPFQKLHQVANGFMLDHSGTAHELKSQPKLDELLNMLEEAEGQKVIVWAPFTAQIKQIEKRLTEEGIKALTLTGEVPVLQRQELIHSFQDPQGARVLVANPSVGGIGLNLTCAWLEIFMSNWYTPDVRAQAEDRCHRTGQKNPVTIIDLVTEHTIEKKILDTLIRRIDIENQILSPEDILGGGK